MEGVVVLSHAAFQQLPSLSQLRIASRGDGAPAAAAALAPYTSAAAGVSARPSPLSCG
jgi:hypothetical protein